MNSAVTLVDFDRLLNGLDHIYSEFSRACGLSDCAYWMLVDTSTAGGSATLEFAEGSRKNKVVCLTKEGRQFAERYALPALKAEQRAFCALEPCEQREIMRLIGKFSQVLDEECETFKQQVAAAGQTQDQCEGESCDC